MYNWYSFLWRPPWVTQAKHIGNLLHEDGTTYLDVRVKKGIFIQNAMELDQEFHCLPADQKMRLNLLYNSHFCSSSMWRFESEEARHLFSSWNKNIKMIYDIPWATHKWKQLKDHALLQICQVCQCHQQVQQGSSQNPAGFVQIRCEDIDRSQHEEHLAQHWHRGPARDHKPLSC